MQRTIAALLAAIILALAGPAQAETTRGSAAAFPNKMCYAEDTSIANGTGADFVDLRELNLPASGGAVGTFNAVAGVFSVKIKNRASDDLLIQFFRARDLDGAEVGSIPASEIATPAVDGTPSQIVRLGAGEEETYPGAWAGWRWQSVDGTGSAKAVCNH